MRNLHRVHVVLDLNPKVPPAYILGAKGIYTKMSAHPDLFPAPPVAFSILLTQITEAEDAHGTVAGTKAIGTAQVRELKLFTLQTSLESERSYVESLCNQDLEHAFTLAASAGMKVVERHPATKELLAAGLVPTKGTVQLKANASLLEAPGKSKYKQRTYLWRYTLDGGKTFIDAPSTPVSETEIAGLPLMTEVGFEVAVKDSVGQSKWSHTVKIFVH